MSLKEILNENIIDLDLKGSTKDAILRELSRKLLEEKYISNIEEFIKDIYVREAEGVTGMGNHIAIPHGKSDSVKKIGIAIGRSNHYVEWESYDDEPVNLFFLFCVSNDNDFAKNHMMLLAELASKLGNDERVSKLQCVKTKDELINILCE